MNEKAMIQGTYDKFADSYDNMISLRKWWAKFGVGLVWGFPDTAYSGKVLDGIPDGFDGRLLDIPAGTGALTEQKYRGISNAQITCADYSTGMLAVAQKRFEGLKNVTFEQADVGKLPFDSGFFDIVLTMNGLHAFPDKTAAFAELQRVIKPGGTLSGCSYVRGEVKRTDWVVKNIYTRRGFFTPPYWTKSELEKILLEHFAETELWSVGAIAGFQCRKL